MENSKIKNFIKRGIVLSLSLLMIQAPFMGNTSFAQETKGQAPTKKEQTGQKDVAPTENKENNEEETTDTTDTTNTTEETTEEPVEEIPKGQEEESQNEEEHNIANLVNGQMKTISDDAIYQIEIGYEFEDGSFDMWAQGTGFLITNKDVLTAQTLVDTSTTSNLYKKMVKERAEAYSRIGVSLANENQALKGIKTFITNSAGEKIEATNITTQNGMGIITLPKVSATEVTIFQDANRVNKSPGQEVVIKFDGKENAKSDAQLVSGTIEPNENPESKSYLVNADTSNGCPLGAPVLNADGSVIGMVSSTMSPMTIIPNDVIETYLISNGVKYKTVLSIEKERQAEEQKQAEEAAKKAEEAIVDKTPLEDKLKEVKDIELKEYTDETVTALKTAIEEGEKLLETSEITKDQVAVATENIETAKEGLKEKSFLNKILGSLNEGMMIPILIGIGVIFALVFIVLIIAKKRRKNRETTDDYEDDDELGYSEELRRQEEEDLKRINRIKDTRHEEDNRYPNIVRKGSNEVYDEGLDVTSRTAPKNLRVSRNATVQGVKYADRKYSETDGVSNLGGDIYNNYDEGDEGTTFLNENELPTLTRIDTGEKFKINDGFVIGKQKSKVDYCITGNSTISRTHAAIRKIKDDYYIEDLSSKNYTYLNGNQIAEYMPALLENGSIIKLSNVEFVYEEA